MVSTEKTSLVLVQTATKEFIIVAKLWQQVCMCESSEHMWVNSPFPSGIVVKDLVRSAVGHFLDVIKQKVTVISSGSVDVHFFSRPSDYDSQNKE